MSSGNISSMQWGHWKKQKYGCYLLKIVGICQVKLLRRLTGNAMNLVRKSISYMKIGNRFKIFVVRFQTSDFRPHTIL